MRTKTTSPTLRLGLTRNATTTTPKRGKDKTMAIETISDILERIRRTTREAVTTRLTIQELTSKSINRKFIEETPFETFREPKLEKMYEEALRWLYAISIRHFPHWITFCGKSGTGKTYIASKLFDFCEKYMRDAVKIDGDRNSLVNFYGITAADLAENFREYGADEYALNADVLFLDDIGAEKDTTGFARGKICELLSARLGKWTILTSNFTLTELGNEYDNRITSRIIRDNNVFVPLYWREKATGAVKFTPDYATRKFN